MKIDHFHITSPPQPAYGDDTFYISTGLVHTACYEGQPCVMPNERKLILKEEK